MKHKNNTKHVEVEHQNDKGHDEKRHEIYKAVAQAWHSHFNNAKFATCEFDVRRRNFQSKPTRFKLEAVNKMIRAGSEDAKKVEWIFQESLWDSYEIVAVSKRLETGLVSGYDSSDLEKIGESNRVFRKRKESKNSLRSLFNVMSSRRFNDAEVSNQKTC